MPRNQLQSLLLGNSSARRLLDVCALFAFVFLFGLAEPGTTFGFLLSQLHLVSLAVVIVGGGLAAIVAYRDGGLLFSCLTVFAPTVAMLLHVFVISPNGSWLTFTGVAIGFSLVPAVFVGTLGYALGRLLATRDGRLRSEMGDGTATLLLGGDDLARANRYLALSVVLFVASATTMTLIGPYTTLFGEARLYELFSPFGPVRVYSPLGAGMLFGWVCLAAWPAFRNRGLVVSWLLVFGPMVGGLSSYFVIQQTSGGTVFVNAALGLLMATIMTLALGTVGFVIGVGARVLSKRLKPATMAEL
ncbi:hypothetical protein SAMN04487949_3173 [Halogranum gelatinilyticum]|uniref:Uncharacterized protein n=1 Tax=Halogranum gelatinilyticum TaxID=660521 RepID=A0A1G9XXU7_9EURY|nr:hypothetical protein [Halogranum gelatinilyticum]SDN01578.1 hypothetical protein SAMN04487949_3173 [Halogranum gelatinilyticum]